MIIINLQSGRTTISCDGCNKKIYLTQEEYNDFINDKNRKWKTYYFGNNIQKEFCCEECFQKYNKKYNKEGECIDGRI